MIWLQASELSIGTWVGGGGGTGWSLVCPAASMGLTHSLVSLQAGVSRGWGCWGRAVISGITKIVEFMSRLTERAWHTRGAPKRAAICLWPSVLAASLSVNNRSTTHTGLSRSQIRGLTWLGVQEWTSGTA